MADQFPQNFGSYVLLELIARGGMAEIYRAKMRSDISGFEKQVAIKKILPNLALNDEFITMLIDEAQICVSLNHANIAQVYDLGRVDNTYYISMEYVPGIDLSGIIKRLAKQGYLIPLDHAIFVTKELCAGLYFAHNKTGDDGKPLNIIHRDVSPHNVLLSFNGDVKLIDFGVAKASVKLGQTRMGVIKGKLLYMAPEQAMARPIDCRADLFSAGLVLYKMLTGRLPFEADNEFQIYNKVLTAQITSPKAINPDIPDQLNAVTMKALERDPNNRYQDGWSMHHDLEQVLHQVSPGYTSIRLSRFMDQYFGDEKPVHLHAKSPPKPAPAPAPTPPPDADEITYPNELGAGPNTPAPRLNHSSPEWEEDATDRHEVSVPHGANGGFAAYGGQPYQTPSVPDPARVQPAWQANPNPEAITTPHGIPSGSIPAVPKTPSGAPLPAPEELGFVRGPGSIDGEEERTVDMQLSDSMFGDDSVDEVEPTVNMNLSASMVDVAAAARPASGARKRKRVRRRRGAGAGILVAMALLVLFVLIGGTATALFVAGAFSGTSEDEEKVEKPEPKPEPEPEPPPAPNPAEALAAATDTVSTAHRAAARDHKRDVTITLNSVPEGAKVVAAGRTLGTTPLKVATERSRKTVRYIFRNKGFQPATAELIPDRDRSTSVVLKERGRRASANEDNVANKPKPDKKPEKKPDKKPKKNDDDGLIDPW